MGTALAVEITSPALTTERGLVKTNPDTDQHNNMRIGRSVRSKGFKTNQNTKTTAFSHGLQKFFILCNRESALTHPLYFKWSYFAAQLPCVSWVSDKIVFNKEGCFVPDR